MTLKRLIGVIASWYWLDFWIHVKCIGSDGTAQHRSLFVPMGGSIFHVSRRFSLEDWSAYKEYWYYFQYLPGRQCNYRLPVSYDTANGVRCDFLELISSWRNCESLCMRFLLPGCKDELKNSNEMKGSF